MTEPDRTTPSSPRLDALRDRFQARAAGWWRVGPDGLEQVAFSAADDMPEAVATEFARATRSVPLGRADLGIVRAASTGKPAISRARELPADSGSGLWLRRFGAVRSVAVPLADREGTVRHVVSVALAGETPDEESVSLAIRDEAGRWSQESGV